MVDFESYFRYGPSVAHMGSLVAETDSPECGCIECREDEDLKKLYRTRFDEQECQQKAWEDEQYILCPPRVLGYILRDKQWAQLQVSLLHDIPEKDPNDSWTTRLKLPDGDTTKDLILDLVKGHSPNTTQDDNFQVDDIIARKGKGLVILLYGTVLPQSTFIE